MKVLLGLVVILFGLSSLLAQEVESPLSRLGDDSYNIGKESLGLVSAPLRWEGKDFMTLGAIAVASVGTSLADRKIRSFGLFRTPSKTKDELESVGATWGSFGPIAALVAVALFDGVATGHSWSRETAAILTSSMVATHLVSYLGKYSFGRHRPPRVKDNDPGRSQYEFHPFTSDISYHSVPSGHLSYALTASFAMAQQFQSHTMKIFFYSLAGLTSFARVYSSAHWPSDVVFTGLVSYFITKKAKEDLTPLYTQKEGSYAHSSKKKIDDFMIFPGDKSLFISFSF